MSRKIGKAVLSTLAHRYGRLRPYEMAYGLMHVLYACVRHSKLELARACTDTRNCIPC
jgi:hypothetical protein